MKKYWIPVAMASAILILVVLFMPVKGTASVDIWYSNLRVGTIHQVDVRVIDKWTEKDIPFTILGCGTSRRKDEIRNIDKGRGFEFIPSSEDYGYIWVQLDVPEYEKHKEDMKIATSIRWSENGCTYLMDSNGAVYDISDHKNIGEIGK